MVRSIHGRHEMALIDKIFAAKVYPANMDSAVPEATRISKRMYCDRNRAMNKVARQKQATSIAAMERHLQNYKFKAPLKAFAYGPARRIFAGRDYVQEETPTTVGNGNTETPTPIVETAIESSSNSPAPGNDTTTEVNGVLTEA